MRFSSLLLRISSVLLPLSILSTTYLYLYPFFHRCAFPSPPLGNYDGLRDCAFEDENLREHYVQRPRKQVAPFRLLAFGDPQLEGDTSLPSAAPYAFPGFQSVYSEIWNGEPLDAVKAVGIGVQDVVTDMLRLLKYVHKQVDLVGNDYYLAHIYRTMDWYTAPTHVTVLGDLLGSQWVRDKEFERRRSRFWTRVFRGASITERGNLQEYKGDDEDAKIPRVEILGASPEWRNRIINLAGNHDIGYAGDINEGRIDRFEAAFGPVNGDIHFTLPSSAQCHQESSLTNGSNDTTPPTLRLIVLNSMNLDVPALTQSLQSDTYNFVNNLIGTSSPVESHKTSTILLTHIPLHKEEGICADSPFFSFFPEREGGGIKEQNMISQDLSNSAILEGIFGKSANVDATMRGMGRDGIVLTGHDHVGCDVYHFADRKSGEWLARKWGNDEAQEAAGDEDIPGLREVTMRSMMGEFGGNAGLVAAWWENEKGRWFIEVSNCSLGVQHIWWAVHVLDLITFALFLFAALSYAVESKSTSIKYKRKADQSGSDIWKKPTLACGDKKDKKSSNGGISYDRKPAVKLKE